MFCVSLLKEGFKEIVVKESSQDYFQKLISFLKNSSEVILPKQENIFEAFKYFSLQDTKVVIIGQDPYPNKDFAHGLSFSSLGNKTPMSLKNIFKELENDLNIKRKNDNLSDWAKQGVLLLNIVLTTFEGKSNAHKNKGWEIFNKKVIEEINEKCEHVTFILWGNNAQKIEYLINKNKHLIIKSAHPSPLSAYNGFFNSKPFSKTNNFLKTVNVKTIKW